MPGDKLTEEVLAKLVEYIRNGNYPEVAAAAVGINSSTFYRWRKSGKELLDLFPQIDPADFPEEIIPPEFSPREWRLFRLEIEIQQAEAQAEAYAVLTVRKHMPEQWTAAMTFLERRHPDRWRKRQTIDMPGQTSSGIDEKQLIEDPVAVKLLHEALQRMARGESPEPVTAQSEQKKLPPGEAQGQS